MAVMNLQNDGKQVMRLCNQFVQEWVPSVSAGAGVKHDLMIYIYWYFARPAESCKILVHVYQYITTCLFPVCIENGAVWIPGDSAVGDCVPGE